MPPFIIIFSRFHNTKKHKFTLETSFVMVYKKYCQFLNVGSGVYAIKDFFQILANSVSHLLASNLFSAAYQTLCPKSVMLI